MSWIKVCVFVGLLVTASLKVSAQEITLQYSVDGAATWNDLAFGEYIQNPDGSIQPFGLPTVSNALYRLDIKKTLPPEDENMVEVFGGVLPLDSDLALTIVPTFNIGRYEVTVGEWNAIVAWGQDNGYTNFFPRFVKRTDIPVAGTFTEALLFCNAKSELHGLQPVYELLTGQVFRNMNVDLQPGDVFLVFHNTTNNGFRLPSEAEWEYAARGGNLSQGYTYSGSTNVNDVAWHRDNSRGNRYAFYPTFVTEAYPIGLKRGNELDLYDMSGNMSEWCFDVGDDSERAVRGGSFANNPIFCEVGYRRFEFPFVTEGGFFNAHGFRVARDVDP